MAEPIEVSETHPDDCECEQCYERLGEDIKGYMQQQAEELRAKKAAAPEPAGNAKPCRGEADHCRHYYAGWQCCCCPAIYTARTAAPTAEQGQGESTPLVYLASPYSHSDPAIREQRFAMACKVTMQLIEAGEMIFSPIVHSHPLVEHGAGTDWQTWQHYDRAMIDYCSEVRVLQLKGWQESVGVQAEIAYATEHGKQVTYLAPPPEGQQPERLGTCEVDS